MNQRSLIFLSVLEKKSTTREKMFSYLFYFSGVYDGRKIRQIEILSEKELTLTVGHVYCVKISVLEIWQQVIRGTSNFIRLVPFENLKNDRS